MNIFLIFELTLLVILTAAFDEVSKTLGWIVLWQFNVTFLLHQS